MLINANDIITLRVQDITVDGITYVRAFDIVQRSPLLVREAKNRAGVALYAVHGGQRGTEQEIRRMLQEAD